MKKLTVLFLALLINIPLTSAEKKQLTWSNWTRRLDRAFKNIPARSVPGRALGILVPHDPRRDLLPMPAFGYEVLASENISTVIFLMSAPPGSDLNGISLPDMDYIETWMGDFPVNRGLAEQLQQLDTTVILDNGPYYPIPNKTIETQLAQLRYVLKNRIRKVSVLPILVKFDDLNSMVKDLGPAIAETIKDYEDTNNVAFVIASDLVNATSEDKLIPADNALLNSIRNLDIEGAISLHNSIESGDVDLLAHQLDSLALGLLTLRWMGADHGEILAYANTGQLVLTKDKSKPKSFVTAAFATGELLPPRIPHVSQEKLLETFGELLREDLLTLTRKTVVSILDPTAAKPPSLDHKQARKKWPVYVTLYTEKGEVGGQAGAHVSIGPLQESIRRFSFDAVKQAKPALTKESAAKYVVDVSIPHGFNSVSRPEGLIPALHGIILKYANKTSAFHPDAWRRYPDPQQLLASISYNLGLKPWAYATKKASLESFRIMAFNEKEPFIDLGADSRRKKKKKKKSSDDDFSDDAGGGDSGAFDFPF